MTSPRTGPPRPGPVNRATFRRLIEELQELGFEPVPESTRPGHAVYAATDSRVLVTVIDEPGRRQVCVSAGSGGGGQWGLDWSARTPHAVQLIALYAALNDDPQAALHGAAAAIGVPDPTGCTDRPSTAG
jgi:hypothetical protein